jgi:hypothetical protein
MERKSRENRYSGGIPKRVKANAKRPNCTMANAMNRRKRKMKKKIKEMGIEHGRSFLF